MSVSIYSLSELKFVHQFQKQKDSFLKPTTNYLARLGVTANSISALSAVLLAVGLLVAAIYARPGIFITTLWLHVFLDGLDGAMARNQREKLSPWVDIIVDYGGIVSAIAMARLATSANLSSLFAFLSVYSAAIAFIVWRHHLGHPYRLVIRPRLLLYLAITSDILINTTLTQPVIYLGLLMLIPVILIGAWTVFKKTENRK